VDATTSVEVGAFEEPEVVAVEVAERHRVGLAVASLLKVESFKFCYAFWTLVFRLNLSFFGFSSCEILLNLVSIENLSR
jgi:hypothetical protein